MTTKQKKTGKIKIGVIGIGTVGKPLVSWLIKEKKYRRKKTLFLCDKNIERLDDEELILKKAKIIFVCVWTPEGDDGSCDISAVEKVAEKFAKPGKVMVIKSTIPPGTTLYFSKKYPESYWLFNPEFLTASQPWIDFIRPDRQIVAPANEKAKKWVKTVLDLLPLGWYQSPGVKDTYNFYDLDSTQAEITKYCSNAFGALKVAYFNTVFDECKALFVDHEPIIRAITADRRIGDSWSMVMEGKHGRGYGGECLPKDTKARLFYHKALLKNMSCSDGVIFSAMIKIFEAVNGYNNLVTFPQIRRKKEKKECLKKF